VGSISNSSAAADNGQISDLLMAQGLASAESKFLPLDKARRNKKGSELMGLSMPKCYSASELMIQTRGAF
jgi:hypothetical protein